MYLLDTDHVSLLERDNADSRTLQTRLALVPAEEVATTIVTYEEQMRGWLARAAQANSTEKIVAAYTHLETHIRTFQHIPIVSFNARAGAVFERLRRAGARIGTMDLKIAAIAMTNDATLLSRNLTDFGKLAGLLVEDWST